MESRSKNEFRRLAQLGIVIGLIAFCVSIGGIGAMGAFICFVELRWGLLVLSILAFSCSIGAGYVLVNYYYVLMEKKEAEDKERKLLIEEEIENKYNSKFTELKNVIERESLHVQRLIQENHYGGFR